MINFRLGQSTLIIIPWQFFFKLKSKKGFHLGYGYEFPSGSDRLAIRNSTHEVMLRLELKSKKSEEIDNNLETQENE